MPKKQYRHTEYAKAAKKRARAKLCRVGFELNMPQTEMARNFDVEAHGASSLHILSKRLLLAYLEEHSDSVKKVQEEPSSEENEINEENTEETEEDTEEDA